MSEYIYPSGYTVPTSTPSVLTAPQRLAVKDNMKAYITAADRKVITDELIKISNTYIETNYSIYIHSDILNEIAAEILAEWGAPGE
jgi:hypothetical protein